MLILGIDPGFDRVGWGVLEKKAGRFSFVSCGIIQTKKTMPLSERLMVVEEEIEKVFKEFVPQQVVIESLFFSTNVKTAIDVAQARGVIMLTSAKYCDVVIEKTPMQIKSVVTGDGHADKKAVEKMVRLQVPGVPNKLQDDTLDALAAALTSDVAPYSK